MRKEVLYTYLGANGTVTTSIKLEGVPAIKKYRLAADANKLLPSDGVHFTKLATIPADELEMWKEVDDGQN